MQLDHKVANCIPRKLVRYSGVTSFEKARLVANRAYLVRTVMRLVHEEDGRQLLANAQWMLHRVWS